MKSPFNNTEPLKVKWRMVYDEPETKGKTWGREYRKGNEYIKIWKPAQHKGFRVSYGIDRMGMKLKKEFPTKKSALGYVKKLMLK